MKTGRLPARRSPGLRPLALFACLAASAITTLEAEEPAGPARGSPLSGLDLAALPVPPLLIDEPGDGAIWVRGTTYKASFSAAGATYVPYLGSHAPRNFPVRFVLAGAWAGGTALPVASRIAPRREGGRIVFDRGALRERYECAAERIEQVFVVDGVPPGGDLVVRMELETDLEMAESGDGGLDVAAAGLGGVRDGGAVAFDAAGRRVDAVRSRAGRAIELRVPAAFVAAAAGPITIDPVISTSCLVCTPFVNNRNPDVSYDATTDRFLAVYEMVFSAMDTDIRSIELDSNGVFVPGSIADIDNTTVSWWLPRTANSNRTNRHLVVAAAAPPSAGMAVWGRFRNAGSTALEPQFQISDSDTSATSLCVGGNSALNEPADFCVAWIRGECFIGCRYRLNLRTLDSGGLTVGSVAEPVAFPDLGVAVSRSRGAAGWTVAWHTGEQPNVVQAVQARPDGTITPRFDVLASPGALQNRGLGASSPDPEGRVLITWTRNQPAGSRVFGRVFQGPTPLTPETDLSFLGGLTPSNADHGEPSVDSDGCGFTVAFRAGYLPRGDIHAATFHYVPIGRIGLTEGRRDVALSTAYSDEWPRIASKASAGGSGPRHLIVWHRDDPAVPEDRNVLVCVFDSIRAPCFPPGVFSSHFAEDFEGPGLGAYTESGGSPPGATLWHAEGYCFYAPPPSLSVPIPASFGRKAAAYNRGDLGAYHYDTGLVNSGAIESPVIPSSDGSSRFLSFDYLRETDGGSSTDVCFVEARPAGAGPWTVAAQLQLQRTCGAPEQVTVPIPIGNGSWQHRFRFDTVTTAANQHRGWYVDNVVAWEIAPSGGSFTVQPTRCGLLTIVPSGTPVIGGTVTYRLFSVVGAPVLWLGSPILLPLPLCPPASCLLGATQALIVPGTVLTGTIPYEPSLIGAVFSVQGADAGGAGGCGPATFGVPVNVSHTIRTTVGEG
jgi:hypothetical protein